MAAELHDTALHSTDLHSTNLHTADLRSAVVAVFRSVFEDPALIVGANTVASDVDGWDSLGHINLIVALEHRFAVKFRLAELHALKNVGDLERLLQTRGAKI